eukprot:gnl/TRDRNA2_/TRDRNA2_126722_c0_seq1.p1 gnl/TRDRNA2_/TRDRNA2_126722_c0~~gnl/TRDRNA2_/TRDRNA2_126722_c0_seq1.p1  ORF type:complete len:293 (-),score=53.01 gnl/TRDRNA2_/TRDRNA2_126722_c0_seq1:7-885(-)
MAAKAAAAVKKAPRIAASLVLLRPRKNFTKRPSSKEDYEVLMMERSDKRGAFRGAVVFPGGVVDAADHAEEWAHILAVDQFSRRQQLKLGAVRELFEETGILLSSPPVQLDGKDARAHRERVHSDGYEFLKVCQELGVKPDIGCLTHVHTWVTPSHVPNRFDTSFFLAVAESARGAEADGGETVRVAWLPPSSYLEMYDRQEVSFLPPQYYLLSTLAGTPTLEGIVRLKSAVDESLVHPWQPHVLSKDEGPGMCYPGDASYPVDGPKSPLIAERSRQVAAAARVWSQQLEGM